MPTALQFGAGNIGRGFIAQLFRESDLDVEFVDVDESIVRAINARGSYTIHIVGPGKADVEIDGIRAMNGADSANVARAVSECVIACTAVGAGALPHIAPNIAAGLVERYRLGKPPLNILICENLHDAAGALRALVLKHLPAELRDSILEQTGFVQAVVSRMVPLQEPAPDDPLSINVEAYHQLPIDSTGVVGELTPISGIAPVDNFEAHMERKLYTHNCGHATLGYLGYLFGIRYGWEALRKPHIIWRLRDVLDETGEALLKRYGFNSSEQSEHESQLLDRFANRDLGDTCFRLGRDPIRKLAPQDRLVGAIRMCQAVGVHVNALTSTVGCALAFDAPEDPSAVELQARIKRDSPEAVLNDVCGIKPDEEIAGEILESYKEAVEMRESVRAGARFEE